MQRRRRRPRHLATPNALRTILAVIDRDSRGDEAAAAEVSYGIATEAAADAAYDRAEREGLISLDGETAHLTAKGHAYLDEGTPVEAREAAEGERLAADVHHRRYMRGDAADISHE
jgi:hypothetical protein